MFELGASNQGGSAMKIQINTDENIDGGESLSAKVSAQLHDRLDRFSQHITRIEVHLSDSNAEKSGTSDKRCLIEARLEGRQPEAVSNEATTLESACSGAINKLQRALESTIGKLTKHRGGDTIRSGLAADAIGAPSQQQGQRQHEGSAAKNSSDPADVDRPGFDLGGSTGKTSAGTGLGLGDDASENRSDRSLPGRRNVNR